MPENNKRLVSTDLTQYIEEMEFYFHDCAEFKKKQMKLGRTWQKLTQKKQEQMDSMTNNSDEKETVMQERLEVERQLAQIDADIRQQEKMKQEKADEIEQLAKEQREISQKESDVQNDSHCGRYRCCKTDLCQAGIRLDTHKVRHWKSYQKRLDQALDHNPYGLVVSVEIAYHTEQNSRYQCLRSKPLQIIKALLDNAGIC